MKVTQIKNEKLRLHAIEAFHTVMKRTGLNLIWSVFFIIILSPVSSNAEKLGIPF